MYRGEGGCGLAATFDLAAFSGFYDRHIKVICQPFENRNAYERAHNANITQGTTTCLSPFLFRI